MNDLSAYRAGQVITGIDLFKLFVNLPCASISNDLHQIVLWMRQVKTCLQFVEHPISVFLLSRIYFVCGKLFDFSYAETTRLLQEVPEKVHPLFFF